MEKATFYIFSGLPATGKSTLAKELAKKINATLLRADTVEQGLRDVCKIHDIEGKGYRLSYLIARENLLLGKSVIADSVNPWDLTRNEWNEVATSARANYINIEVICSDENELKHRVENREVDIENLELPNWEQVKNRDYHEWTMPRLVIDTYNKSIEDSFQELLEKLKI